MTDFSERKNTPLPEHQGALLELLREFDRVCRGLDIPYMLFAGTLLGAVRHKGFIPWDDDLDIILAREHYERFLREGESFLNGERFFLQKEFGAHWPMPFSKLRLNNTACIERYIPRDPLTHQGVYIDIFPLDDLCDRPFMRKVQFAASKVVIAQCLDRRGYLTDSFGKKLFMLVCRLLPRKAPGCIARGGDKNTQMVHCFFGAASKYEKSVFPRAWFSETAEMPFEDGVFTVPSAWDEILTTLYGDYMTPLPEGKRGVKVHAEFVDLNRSYEEYAGMQKTMTFKEYTRSIR